MLAILKSGDVDILLDQSSEREGWYRNKCPKKSKDLLFLFISWICARSHDQLFTDLIEDEKERIRLCGEVCGVRYIYIYIYL